MVKTLKKIISLILFLAFIIAIVFNILFIFNKISRALLYGEFIILLLIIFLISLLGIIMKNIMKDDVVSINITTPAKELGVFYSGALIIWCVTYFIAIIFK